MTTAVKIAFHQMDSSPAVEAAVAKEVEHLERLCPNLRTCDVTIDAPHRSQQKGRHFHVIVKLGLGAEEVVASRDSGRDSAHEDVYLALRDAFRAVRREVSRLAGQLHEHRA